MSTVLEANSSHNVAQDWKKGRTIYMHTGGPGDIQFPIKEAAYKFCGRLQEERRSEKLQPFDIFLTSCTKNTCKTDEIIRMAFMGIEAVNCIYLWKRLHISMCMYVCMYMSMCMYM